MMLGTDVGSSGASCDAHVRASSDVLAPVTSRVARDEANSTAIARRNSLFRRRVIYICIYNRGKTRAEKVHCDLLTFVQSPRTGLNKIATLTMFGMLSHLSVELGLDFKFK